MNDLADENNSEERSEKKPNTGLAILLALIVIIAAAVAAYFILIPKETPLEKAMKMVKENKSASAVPFECTTAYSPAR